jgi:hypothetical protein
MFTLGSMSPTYWQTVKAEFPSENGGVMPAQFDVRFKRMTIEEAESASEEAQKGNPREGIAELILQIAVDWKGLGGESRDDVLAFTPENVRRVVNAGLGPAILETFRASLPKAKLKN